MNDNQIRVLHWLDHHGGKDVSRRELSQHLYFCTTAPEREKALSALQDGGHISARRKTVIGKRGTIPTLYSLTKRGRAKVKELRKEGVIA